MSAKKLLLDSWFIFYVQTLEQRSFLAFIVFFGSVFPVLLVFSFGRIGGGVPLEGMLYVISGTAVVSLVAVGTNMVGQNLAGMKNDGTFLYYASLPISKASLLLGVLGAKALIAFPGVVLSLLAGHLLYGTPLPLSPLVVVVMLLSTLTLSGVGAAIGLAAPTQEVASFVCQMTMIVVMTAAPVLIPQESLPGVLQVTGYLLPPTYAADALRRVLVGVHDLRLLLDLGALALFAVGSLVVTARALNWRQNA